MLCIVDSSSGFSKRRSTRQWSMIMVHDLRPQRIDLYEIIAQRLREALLEV